RFCPRKPDRYGTSLLTADLDGPLWCDVCADSLYICARMLISTFSSIAILTMPLNGIAAEGL
ncbi:MAG TPA: hypothetical protein VHJ19_09200, partial [Gammaproteobacteria bacterium]|nr:hypothetical protein [Gammaproteobacteria bacterium]